MSQRNAFTIVELIFLIVIFGILASIDLLKFEGKSDKNTANLEMETMNSLNGIIADTIKVYLHVHGNTNISWHNTTMMGTTRDARASGGIYYTINSQKKVFSSILDNHEKFRIIHFASSNGTDMVTMGTTASPATHDVLFITGDASDATHGMTAITNDILGEPDKNDIWVFNPNSFDINVSDDPINIGIGRVIGSEGKYVMVPAQSIKLIDVNGIKSRPTFFRVTKIGGSYSDISNVTQ